MRQTLNEKKRAEIIALVKNGGNPADVAILYGCSRDNVYGLCRRAGVKISPGRRKKARLKALKKELYNL